MRVRYERPFDTDSGEDGVACNSDDFAAAVAPEAAQLAASDMDCTGGTGVVFSGKAMECKKAVGGIINCCRRAESDALGWPGQRHGPPGGGDGAMGVDAAGIAVRGGGWRWTNPPAPQSARTFQFPVSARQLSSIVDQRTTSASRHLTIGIAAVLSG
jgi:hypothetical protein